MNLKRKIKKILKGLGIDDNDALNEAVEDVNDIFVEQRERDSKETKPEEPQKDTDSKDKDTDPNSEIEKLKAEHAAELAKVKLDNKIESVINAAKAKNATAVRALLDVDGLELDDKGEIKGLKEQLAKVVEDNPFLFDVESESGAGSKGDEEEPQDTKEATSLAKKHYNPEAGKTPKINTKQKRELNAYRITS